MRRPLTWLAILGGMALMVVSYFFLAAPWGADAAGDSNPRFSFAPALFVVGVILVFGSAVLYEVLPDRKRP
jgi:uncharacterized BrkB/YihY/UPF0761 family membrane protein